MKLAARHENLRFVIEESLFTDEEDKQVIWWYLFVYNQEQACLYDYLQDSQEMAKEFANEEFGVPLSAWKITEQ